jgi:hypothetical protein
MANFKNRGINRFIEGTDIVVRLIPKECLEVHARLLWENQGRPDGKHLEHWKEAEHFFRNYVVIPTEKYLHLERNCALYPTFP